MTFPFSLFRPQSIATRIAVMLGGFCLVLCALLFSLLQLLQTLSIEAEETVGVYLPDMNLASYISTESEWIKNIAHDSMLCRDRFMHFSVLQEIKTRRFPDNLLSRIDDLAVAPLVREKLRNNIRELESTLTRTNAAVAQRIDNLRRTERIAKRIFSLNRELSLPAYGGPRLEAWKSTCATVFNAMLLLSSHTDRPYSLRLKSEIRAGLQHLQDLATRLHRPDLTKFTTDITDMALAEDGLIPLYEAYTTLEAELDTLKLIHQYTAGSLIDTANTIFGTAWKRIEDSKTTLAKRYSRIVLTLVATVFFSIILSLLIYIFIVSHVVNPVKKLNRCMLDRVNRIPTPFPENVRYELAEMAASVRYFTSEIEKNEKALLHSREDLERQVAERTGELKTLSEKLLMAQESERFKLAAELHDNIGATVGAIKFGIERSVRSVRGMPPHNMREEVCDTLTTAVTLVKKLAEHLRRIQNELRPPQLELGLSATIADFCTECQRMFAPLHIDLYIDIDESHLPHKLPIVIFRILQEAFSNIGKHSEATRASVRIYMDSHQLCLEIHDNGKGFAVNEKLADVSRKSGLGLKSLRERAQLSGGSLHIESKKGSGTTIRLVWACVFTTEGEHCGPKA